MQSKFGMNYLDKKKNVAIKFMGYLKYFFILFYMDYEK